MLHDCYHTQRIQTTEVLSGYEVHLKNYLIQSLDKIANPKEIYSRNRMDFWA